MWEIVRDSQLGPCISSRNRLIPLFNTDGKTIVSMHNRLATKINRIKKIVGRGEETCCPHCNHTSEHNYLGCGEFRCVDCERSFEWADIVDRVHNVLWPKG